MTKNTGDVIRTWPLKERPRQCTLQELRRMTPDAINQARAAGALEDLMGGAKPAPTEVP
jgi:hypothetical protein